MNAYLSTSRPFHYLRVYWLHVKMGWKVTMMYRANSIGVLVATFCWSVLIISTVVFSTQNVRSILGYSRSELLVLSGIQVIFLGIFHALVSKNIERMPELISTGKLDLMLLKPIDSQFGIAIAQIFPNSVFRVGIGAIFLGYLIHIKMIEPLLIGNVLAFCLLLTLSLVLMYSVWFITATFLVWLPHMDNIVDFLYNLNVISRYPHEMFRELGIVAVLFAYPFSIALAVPMRTLIGKADGGQIVSLIVVTVGLFLASRIFWLFALRHYTSAN